MIDREHVFGLRNEADRGVRYIAGVGKGKIRKTLTEENRPGGRRAKRKSGKRRNRVRHKKNERQARREEECVDRKRYIEMRNNQQRQRSRNTE